MTICENFKKLIVNFCYNTLIELVYGEGKMILSFLGFPCFLISKKYNKSVSCFLVAMSYNNYVNIISTKENDEI